MAALRREGLLVEAVHDEVLVFNPGRSEATALNQSAAQVFELCDGTNSVESMKAALEAAGLGPSSNDAVWLALSELADAGLIDIQVPRPSHLGRRELIKQFGVSAAALSALPVVESLRAPSPDTQGSGGVSPASDSTPTTTTTSTTTTQPTSAPSVPPAPSPSTPTPAPSVSPTPSPSTPTPSPSTPTPAPSVSPTQAPSVSPTQAPSVSPTQAPSVSPTQAPSVSPTPAPTPLP
jgi:hypothetical protein